jgi:hypothetical protein
VEREAATEGREQEKEGAGARFRRGGGRRRRGAGEGEEGAGGRSEVLRGRVRPGAVVLGRVGVLGGGFCKMSSGGRGSERCAPRVQEARWLAAVRAKGGGF